MTYSWSSVVVSSAADDGQPTPLILTVTSTPFPTTTPTAASTATSTAISDQGAAPKIPTFAFSDPVNLPTAVIGGEVFILKPNQNDVGWITDDISQVTNEQNIFSQGLTPPNQLGDSFLYAGILDGKLYHAAIQFDLSEIPRGAKVKGAALRLTGLRTDQLAEDGSGQWQLKLLEPAVDHQWRDLGFEQIHNAVALVTLEPNLTPPELGRLRVNQFEFDKTSLAFLERRILEGPDDFRKVSFRLDGPSAGKDNLFAWDSGHGSASRKFAPELVLNLAPPPLETPPPYYVVVTSTPAPENVMTAAAVSLEKTAEATRYGTATPIPPYWVTPIVVTNTPTPENSATAQLQKLEATAVALTTGQPANLQTATPTPTFVIITSTPTPLDLSTAVAYSLQHTAEANQYGTPTPFPENWVTPVVVTSTPTPINQVTVEYLQAIILTTGTPTPMPPNMQTATATPPSILVEMIASPTPTATPSPTLQPIPVEFVGKIVFLTDREGATEEERYRAGLRNELPRVTPQPYIYDPATNRLERLTARWPYDTAMLRDAWSADKRYETYNQQLLWTNVRTSSGPKPITVFAIHSYDHEYNQEMVLTEFGAGDAWDPVWSPVSNQIALVSNDSGDDEIWIIDLDRNLRRLTETNEAYNAQNIGKDNFIPEVNGHPSWSPDGSQIVFWSNRTGNRQIWIMNADGSNQRLLMEANPYNDWNPVWIKYADPPPPLQRQPDWRFVKPTEAGQPNTPAEQGSK